MRLRVILIGLALALVVAGCGGGGGTGGGGGSTDGSGSSTASGETTGGATGAESAASSGKPLTKAQFIKAGDQVCGKVPERYGKTLKKLEKESTKKPPTKEINLVAAVPPIYEAAEEFAELTPPKGDEGEAEEMVAALESAAKGIEAKPESVLAGPKSPFANFQRLTKFYGFKLCSQL